MADNQFSQFLRNLRNSFQSEVRTPRFSSTQEMRSFQRKTPLERFTTPVQEEAELALDPRNFGIAGATRKAMREITPRELMKLLGRKGGVQGGSKRISKNISDIQRDLDQARNLSMRVMNVGEKLRNNPKQPLLDRVRKDLMRFNNLDTTTKNIATREATRRRAQQTQLQKNRDPRNRNPFDFDDLNFDFDPMNPTDELL